MYKQQVLMLTVKRTVGNKLGCLHASLPIVKYQQQINLFVSRGLAILHVQIKFKPSTYCPASSLIWVSPFR